MLIAYARQVTVTSITPNTVARGATNVLVTVHGTGFDDANAVQIHRGDRDIRLSSIAVGGDTTLTARLSVPADAPTGAWDVRVGSFDGSGFAIGQCGGCLAVT